MSVVAHDRRFAPSTIYLSFYVCLRPHHEIILRHLHVAFYVWSDSVPLVSDKLHSGHVAAVGVKRPGYGTVGRPIDIQVNCFPVDAPNITVYQYDGGSNCAIAWHCIVDSRTFECYACLVQSVCIGVTCTQSEKEWNWKILPAIDPDKLPARANMDVMRQVELDNPRIFTKSIAYDGRKIAYSAINLPLGGLSRTVRIHAESMRSMLNCTILVWSELGP